MIENTPYGWRMTAKAVHRLAIKGQQIIEKRLTKIANDPNSRGEYRAAKNMWEALRSTELRIFYELNNQK